MGSGRRPSIDEMLRRADTFVEIAREHARHDDPAYQQNAAAKGWMAARFAAEAVTSCKLGERPRGTQTLRDAVERVGDAKFDAGFSKAFADMHIRYSEAGEIDNRLRGAVENVAELVATAHKVCKR